MGKTFYDILRERLGDLQRRTAFKARMLAEFTLGGAKAAESWSPRQPWRAQSTRQHCEVSERPTRASMSKGICARLAVEESEVTAYLLIRAQIAPSAAHLDPD